MNCEIKGCLCAPLKWSTAGFFFSLCLEHQREWSNRLPKLPLFDQLVTWKAADLVAPVTVEAAKEHVYNTEAMRSEFEAVFLDWLVSR